MGNDGSSNIDLESDFIDFHYQKAKEDIQQKNFSMAEKRLLKLLARQSYEHQRDNDRYVVMLLCLYDCQSGQNKWEDAKKTLLNLGNYSIDGRLSFQIKYNLANCYFHLGDSNIASDYCKMAMKGFRTTLGTENPIYLMSAALLAQISDSLGEHDEADAYRLLSARNLPPISPSTENQSPFDPLTHRQVIRGHTDSIYTIVFSPDGMQLASGSDRQVRSGYLQTRLSRHLLILLAE